MSIKSLAFDRLVRACTHYPQAQHPVSLHGFLTALVIGPEGVDDNSQLTGVYGLRNLDNNQNHQQLASYVLKAKDDILDELLHHSFEPYLKSQGDESPNLALWIRGFNQAVALNETAWREMNDEFPEAAKKYLFIQSLSGPEIAEKIFNIPKEDYAAYLSESFPLFSQAVVYLYQNYWGEELFDLTLEDEPVTTDLDVDDLPYFSPQDLQRQTDEQLMFNILQYGDMLPREVVDETINRGQPMAVLLRRHLENSNNWNEDADADNWWGLLHAIFILGFIAGEEASKGLLGCIKSMNTYPRDNLWDWLDGYWPTLFENKWEEAREGLEQIVYDRELNWHPRITALDCLTYTAEAAGGEALKQMLEKIARIADDESEDWVFRVTSAHSLLDFPRDAHRGVLERLAYQQEAREEQEVFPNFNIDDVILAYALKESEPKLKRFNDPLKFYDPKNILMRQRRWLEESEGLFDDGDLFKESDELHYHVASRIPRFGKDR